MLLELNDFMALRAIYLALNLTEIARLEHMWSQVDDSGKLVWRTVTSLCQYDKNCAVYRMFVADREPPIVPCPTVFLVRGASGLSLAFAHCCWLLRSATF